MLPKHSGFSLTADELRVTILGTNYKRAEVCTEVQRDWKLKDMLNVNTNIIASIIR